MRFRSKTALILMAIFAVALTFVIDGFAPTVADAAPVPASGTVGFDTDNYSVNEADATVTLTLRRQGGSNGAIAVSFTTTDGTATNGDDYAGVITPINLAWADGDTDPRTVVLPIHDDLITEPNETFTATITATNPDWLNLAAATTTVTIGGTSPAPTTTPTLPATPTPDPTPPAPPAPALPPLPTPMPTPDPIDGPLASGAISYEIADDTVVLTVPAALSVWIDPDQSATLRRNPVVFEGPLPGDGVISFPLGGAGEPFDVTFAATLATGAPYSEIVRITPPAAEATLPHVQAIPAADGEPTPGTRIVLNADEAPGAPTELALTGAHTTTLLILTGFLLVAGAAFVAYSRDLIRHSRFTF